MKIIGRIHTDFPEKFGLPRQSGLVSELTGEIVFEAQYKNEQALRGLEGYSHIWLLWKFDVPDTDEFRPMVKPPRLGGNTRMGVFATRSPFRPNPIGLSCVKIEKIDLKTPKGPVIYVSGIDMADNTAIIDIKPYLPYTDCRPMANDGFAGDVIDEGHFLEVDIKSEDLELFSEDKREALINTLRQDPRPGYTYEDENREYGILFCKKNIRFKVKGNMLKVVKVEDEADYNRDTRAR